MNKLTTIFASIVLAAAGACVVDDPATTTRESALAGTDRLDAGEVLYPDQSIRSGNTELLYQSDNNLVLYQDGNPVWATMNGLGEPTNHLAMQSDCNAVVYGAYGYVWASGTDGRGSSCYAKVIEGDWFICSGHQRVFTARGGGICDEGPGWVPGDPLAQLGRIGDSGDTVAAYLVHMMVNTEIYVHGVTRTFGDMVDLSKFAVVLGNNHGTGTASFRAFYHYTPEGHWMISQAQHHGAIRYHNSNTGQYTHWFGFTQGGIFDPTVAHANMDHAYKSLFEESGKDLCLQPQWNDHSTVGEIDIDFHRQLEVIDHGRPDNSDPLTTCSGGCKNNNWHFHNAWGSPGGLPGYSGHMTYRQTDRGNWVYDFGPQIHQPGFQEVATVLAGRGFGVVTGYAVPR